VRLRDDSGVARKRMDRLSGDGRLVREFRPVVGHRIDSRVWPVSVPAVEQILRSGLELSAGLTILVGENGSGKSTVVELLAEAYGLNPQGGSQLARYSSRDSEPGLGSRLEVIRGPVKPPWAYFLRADTMHGLYTYLEENPSRDRRGEPKFHEMSHGEGFLELLQQRVNDPGFYLLDEPDAPLSFTASLSLVRTLTDLLAVGSQLVVATHSPVLAATPGATILEVGEWGLRKTSWDELELVGSWRRFLADPQRYLRYLLADD
jgi:predicted ATPase